jgi:hypothetical protein
MAQALSADPARRPQSALEMVSWLDGVCALLEES